MSTAEGHKCYSILSSAKVAKEWYERVQRMRQISCVVLGLKKVGFYLCGVLFFVLSTSETRIPGYSSRQNLHTAKCELSSVVTVFFCFTFFPLFFQHE